MFLPCIPKRPHSRPLDGVLRNQGAGGCTLIPPSGWEMSDGLVISRQAMNPGLDKDQSELGVFVLAVPFEMLANGDGLEFVSGL